MYLTSMNQEELYAEAWKGLIVISTKANLFVDKVRKKAKMMNSFPVAPQSMTITRRNNDGYFIVSEPCTFFIIISALKELYQKGSGILTKRCRI